MTNTILDKSYTESANNADALKSSYSFGKDKDTSSSKFMNILSDLTENNLSSARTQTDSSKNSAKTSSFMSKNSQNSRKNTQKSSNNPNQQDMTQVNNDTKKPDMSDSAKAANSSPSAHTNTKDTSEVTQSSDADKQVENNDNSIGDNAEDNQTDVSTNEKEITSTDTQTESEQTLTANVAILLEEVSSSIISDSGVNEEEVVSDEVVEAFNSDDKLDLETINNLNALVSSDEDLESTVDSKLLEEQVNKDNADNDEVKIKVVAETVDTDKTKNKDSKTQVKGDTEITKEILNELDATIVGLEKDLDSSSENDDFSSGQNALEQAVMLSIEGSSEASDSQDVSKLLNVDMLKQIDAKSNVNLLNNVQNAKPATNIDILNQISDKMAEMRNGTADKIEIALKPANLGKVNVEISSVKGVLTATLVAENEHVRGVLDKNIDSLRSTLASQGVNLNSVNVKVNDAEKSAMNNNFDFSKEQFMNNSQDHSKNERAQELYNSTKSDTGSLEEGSNSEGDNVLTTGNTNDNQYYEGLVDYKI